MVIWSRWSKRVHRYEETARPSEACNTDAIKREDRRVEEVPSGDGLAGWARDSKLRLCRRCFPQDGEELSG